MWSETWDTHEQRDRLLAIDTAPDPESANLLTLDAGVGELLAWLEPLGPDRPPELSGRLTARERAWRAWLEYTGESNPYEDGTPGYREWDEVWSRLSKNSGAWEGYPRFSSARVALEFDTSIAAAAKSPRAAGLASLLCGVWIDSNPFPPGSWAADDWEEGWLKGVWIKGFLACWWGKGVDFLDSVRERATSPASPEPFAHDSAETTAWLEGWAEARQREVFSRAYAAALRGDPEPAEEEIAPEELDAWTAGADSGKGRARLEAAEEHGRRSYDLGGSVRGNPYPGGSEESRAWLGGFRGRHGYWEGETEGGVPPLEECERCGRVGKFFPARQEGTDAGLRGEPLSANPYGSESSEAERWARGWVLAQQIVLPLDDEQDCDDEWPDEDDDELPGEFQTLEEQAADLARLTGKPEAEVLAFLQAQPKPEPPAPRDPLARAPEPADTSKPPRFADREAALGDGCEAQLAGHPQSANPYGIESVWAIGMRRAWEFGWGEAYIGTLASGARTRPAPEPEDE